MFIEESCLCSYLFLFLMGGCVEWSLEGVERSILYSEMQLIVLFEKEWGERGLSCGVIKIQVKKESEMEKKKNVDVRRNGIWEREVSKGKFLEVLFCGMKYDFFLYFFIRDFF